MTQTTLEKQAGIKRDAINGVFWAACERAGRQVIQVLTSITLARLLFPDDFGLMGMAIVFQGIAQLLADFGIGAAIVQHQKVDDVALDSAFWANMFVSVCLTGILILTAPFIGQFYDNQQVVILIQVMSLSLLVAGLRTIPRTLQYKAMEFNVIARIGVLATFIGACVSVGMAWYGFGVWSLIAQPIVGNIVDMVGAWLAVKWRPRWQFKWTSISSLVHFSAGVLGSNLLNYANRNADNMLIGKFLGSGSLGFYSLAYEIALYPLSQIASVIVKVLFPTLSKLQDDIPVLQRVYLRGLSMIAMITFPMMLGLLAIKQEFVTVVLGEQWLPMTPVLGIFCITGLVQSLGTTSGVIFLSMGRTTLLFKFALITTPLLIGSFLIGIKWGLIGVAIAYSLVSIVVTIIGMKIALKLINLTLKDLFLKVYKTLLTSGLMFISVTMLHTYLLEMNDMQILLISVPFGALSYILFSLTINRTDIQNIIHLIKSNKKAI